MFRPPTCSGPPRVQAPHVFRNAPRVYAPYAISNVPRLANSYKFVAGLQFFLEPFSDQFGFAFFLEMLKLICWDPDAFEVRE